MISSHTTGLTFIVCDLPHPTDDRASKIVCEDPPIHKQFKS
jgi:hypothetical protein